MLVSNKMTRARTSLVLEAPFFATLLLRMETIADPMCATMATNGHCVRYNPAWVDTLPIAHVEGVLAHEVMHVAMKHHLRRGKRHAETWNIACDFAINKIVMDAGFDLPEDRLYDERFAGMSAEAIYSQLSAPDEAAEESGDDDGDGDGGKKSGKGKPAAGDDKGDDDADGDDKGDGKGEADASASGSGTAVPWGKVEDAPLDEQSAEEQEADIQIAVAQAANAAKAAGKLPAFLEQIAEEIKNGRVDWRAELRRFCQATARDQYTWNRPDRRHSARGFILPTLHGRSRMGEMVLAIDTSGSTIEFTDEFLSEVMSVAEELRPEKLHVVYCDTQIQKVITIETDTDDIPEKLPRIFGGGTDFAPVFAWVEENDIEPACLVYLTDLYADPVDEPDYPVLWASVTAAEHPFGEVLRLKE